MVNFQYSFTTKQKKNLGHNQNLNFFEERVGVTQENKMKHFFVKYKLFKMRGVLTLH